MDPVAVGVVVLLIEVEAVEKFLLLINGPRGINGRSIEAEGSDLLINGEGIASQRLLGIDIDQASRLSLSIKDR